MSKIYEKRWGLVTAKPLRDGTYSYCYICNGGKALLFKTRKEAQENCKPGERVVRVNIEIDYTAINL